MDPRVSLQEMPSCLYPMFRITKHSLLVEERGWNHRAEEKNFGYYFSSLLLGFGGGESLHKRTGLLKSSREPLAAEFFSCWSCLFIFCLFVAVLFFT